MDTDVAGDTETSDSGNGCIPDKLCTRIKFLTFNLVMVGLALCAGWKAYDETNSLTLELDVWTYAVDMAALLVNLIVEGMKGATAEKRKVLILDVMGCCVSVILNIGVTTWGIYSCYVREVEAEDGDYKDSNVAHTGTMLCYSLFCIVVNAATIITFSVMKDAMYPEGMAHEDRLNVASSLVWTFIDSVITLSVLGTASWLWARTHGFGMQRVTFMESFRQRVQADVVGSSVICVLTVVCSLLLLREVMRVIPEIMGSGVSERATAEKDFAEQTPNYGSVRKDARDVVQET
mmetsp:Transcript_125027/g.249637  ORF Transcript_125027/g.249637 Transcript_125027/m.249637 type:complete len:291 (+) Transcript_125027:189-1061(+)|eukprot:CAMPEP_0172688972 /NCGR_PEP_ID=MMETSP1074-20121228/22810_1 /TAXON_ID=2916 /ORGANISM="Ceratium fusus, Strain PA161109" /LENGTH=290 /DNA_ID=CAMNT_0013508705 /DNA_START=189 /DNA_END=1061 /DNA_ORIENTATION=-